MQESWVTFNGEAQLGHFCGITLMSFLLVEKIIA
jgi:hypothetical protein